MATDSIKTLKMVHFKICFFFFLKQNKTKLFSLIFVVWFCSKGFAVNLVLIYGLNQMMIS